MNRRALAESQSATTPGEAIIAASPSTTNVNTTANAGGPNARRPKRARRTPSQISTKSLPAYNEQPGDEELVLVQYVTNPVLFLPYLQLIS